MDRKDLIKVLSEVFVPLGFKRKGNHWLCEREELIKKVDLQKSQYGNMFYIRYGFIIKALPLEREYTHVSSGLGSSDPVKNTRIKELLYLETDIPDEVRISELKSFIEDILVPRIHSINTEEDLSKAVAQVPSLNRITTPRVKAYLRVE